MATHPIGLEADARGWSIADARRHVLELANPAPPREVVKPVAFALHTFERLEATTDLVLLRVAARVFPPVTAPAGRMRLQIGPRRIAPLPDPGREIPMGEGHARVLRLGFAVPEAQLAGRPLSLDLGDGYVVVLPRPT